MQDRKPWLQKSRTLTSLYLTEEPGLLVRHQDRKSIARAAERTSKSL